MPRLHTTLLFTLLGLLPFPVCATVHLFIIAPQTTSLTLQGSTGTGIWQAQAAGSLTTTFQGWIVADLQSSSIEILSGSRMLADQTNNWQPGILGLGNSAPAAYGATTIVGSGITSINETVALRNLAFDILSPPLPINNGQIDASSVSFTASDPGSVLDYRGNGPLVLHGRRALGGLAAATIAGPMTLFVFAEVQTLTIPIDLSFTTQVFETNDTVLHFTGVLVARRGLTILNRQLLWYYSPANPTQITLIWDGSFKLQQATTLSPPDWTDAPLEPPALLTPTDPSGFFRVTLP